MGCDIASPDAFCSCQEDGLEFNSNNSNLVSLKDFQFFHVFQWSRYGGIKKAQFTAYLSFNCIWFEGRSTTCSISLLKI